MNTPSGERWHCMNPNCRREAILEAWDRRDGTNPRCPCGAVMKREYAPPVLRYLDFLRMEEPAPIEHAPRED
jgi:hypothetical protein